MSAPSEKSRGTAIVAPTEQADPVGESLKMLSEPRPSGERIKSAINRAARLSGLSYWRAWDIWYGKARRVEAFEADAIADALKQKQAKDARNELSELRLRLTRLEAILSISDAEFHRETIGVVGQQLRRSR
jgi:uncharacterized protein YaeQ